MGVSCELTDLSQIAAASPPRGLPGNLRGFAGHAARLITRARALFDACLCFHFILHPPGRQVIYDAVISGDCARKRNNATEGIVVEKAKLRIRNPLRC